MSRQQEDNLMPPRTEDSRSADYIGNVWHSIKSAAQAAFQQYDNKTLSFTPRITHCSCVRFMKCENQNLKIATGVFYGFKLHKTGQILQVRKCENVIF